MFHAVHLISFTVLMKPWCTMVYFNWFHIFGRCSMVCPLYFVFYFVFHLVVVMYSRSFCIYLISYHFYCVHDLMVRFSQTFSSLTWKVHFIILMRCIINYYHRIHETLHDAFWIILMVFLWCFMMYFESSTAESIYVPYTL